MNVDPAPVSWPSPLVQRYVDAAPLGPALAPPADAAALLGAAALAAGAAVALLLQAPTTNTAARAKAPMRLELAIMDTVALPPSPLGEHRDVAGSGREAYALPLPSPSTRSVNRLFADC
jgi:hypothetical protein